MQTIHPPKPNVEQHNIQGATIKQFHACLAALGGFRLVSLILEHALQRLPDGGLIVNNEDIKHAELAARKQPRRRRVVQLRTWCRPAYLACLMSSLLTMSPPSGSRCKACSR